ncbi:MAG: LytS/YhcK type 5TM receptor domain-containing protein, partial [Selenomonadaceae bacterium]
MGEESLLYQMIARMSMAATLAFLLAQIKLFRRVSYQYAGVADKIKLAVIFGLIGIGGTYVGIPVDDALANSRVIGVMAAGLVGGPLVGLGAGLVAGGHRFFLGGFTFFSCALSSVVEGILAGWVKTHYPGRTIPWQVALLTGAAGEVLQMLIILLTASPWEQAMDLVKKIALPMTAANSIGIAVFMLIIKTIIDDQQRTGARQAQKVLHIATKTLPYFRRGMNQESAAAAAAIIYEYGGYDAAAVTDTERILAFAGAEAQHHLQQQHFTRATHQVIKSGEIYMARNAAAIGCAHDGCRLQSAIIVPLKSGVRVVGTIKLYYLASGRLNAADAVFAEGLAQGGQTAVSRW